jgi:serine/threonine protein kinase
MPDTNKKTQTEKSSTLSTETVSDAYKKERTAKVLSRKVPGKYKIEQTIASGGMKTIRQARDCDIGRKVAIAEILPDLNADPAKINRFIQEARITANLEHPNIVPVHELGRNSDDTPYFVMKKLSGETLSSVVSKLKKKDKDYLKKYNLHHRLRIFMKVCNAVAFAHSKNIIHLDIKPENIQVGDFGEVLLLDWGLAKMPDDEKNQTQTEAQNFNADDKVNDDELSNSILDVTLDGVIKGTPGYMAPEQVYGKNKEKDNRTDIYALGAVLYFLLTYKRPVEGDTTGALMVSTLNDEIKPPSERVPENQIPKSLDAVAMKALAFDKKDRYQKVEELIADIDAFLRGYATSAEHAGFVTRFILMLKRHKALALSTALLFLTISAFCVYFAVDYYQRWGNWKKIAYCDFRQNQNFDNLFEFKDALNKTITHPWQKNYGLKMEKDQWLWVKNLKVPGDCRVVVQFLCTGSPAPFIISINAANQPLPQASFVPPGYSFIFGAWNGRRNFISKNSLPAYPVPFGFSSPSSFSVDKVHTITVERKQDVISFSVDDGEPLSLVDFFPPKGKDLSWIGLKTQSPAVSLISLEVYRWAIPEKPLPTIAGDALAEYHHFDEAVAKYIMVAEDTKDDNTAALALLKAYLTASSNNIKNQSDIMQKIKMLMTRKYSKTIYYKKLCEQEILYLWNRQNYQKVFSLLPKLFEQFKETQIILRILQLKHENLPEYAAENLLKWLSKSKEVSDVNISGLGITSLEPLKGVRIISLNCSNNPIGNLDALKGMNLLRLNCAGCGLNSIEPLKDMKLEELIISNNKIKDLTPLRGMPLKRFRCRLNSIDSLEALSGMPLERLECGGNKIEELTPLKNAELTFLGCRKNKIKSLLPLKDMPLIILDCQYNPITDITPLAGMPLRELFLNDCPVSDIRPLQYCSELEKLTIPKTAEDITFLKRLPNLKYLSTKWDIILPEAEKFWKTYHNVPEEKND